MGTLDGGALLQDWVNDPWLGSPVCTAKNISWTSIVSASVTRPIPTSFPRVEPYLSLPCHCSPQCWIQPYAYDAQQSWRLIDSSAMWVGEAQLHWLLHCNKCRVVSFSHECGGPEPPSSSGCGESGDRSLGGHPSVGQMAWKLMVHVLSYCLSFMASSQLLVVFCRLWIWFPMDVLCSASFSAFWGPAQGGPTAGLSIGFCYLAFLLSGVIWGLKWSSSKEHSSFRALTLLWTHEITFSPRVSIVA